MHWTFDWGITCCAGASTVLQAVSNTETCTPAVQGAKSHALGTTYWHRFAFRWCVLLVPLDEQSTRPWVSFSKSLGNTSALQLCLSETPMHEPKKPCAPAARGCYPAVRAPSPFAGRACARRRAPPRAPWSCACPDAVPPCCQRSAPWLTQRGLVCAPARLLLANGSLQLDDVRTLQARLSI